MTFNSSYKWQISAILQNHNETAVTIEKNTRVATYIAGKQFVQPHRKSNCSHLPASQTNQKPRLDIQNPHQRQMMFPSRRPRNHKPRHSLTERRHYFLIIRPNFTPTWFLTSFGSLKAAPFIFDVWEQSSLHAYQFITKFDIKSCHSSDLEGLYRLATAWSIPQADRHQHLCWNGTYYW